MSPALQENRVKPPSRLQKGTALLHATRDLVSLERPSNADIRKYKELFYPLCLRAKTNEKKRISELLGSYEFTPRPIALFLAMDHAEVARPFLESSPVLTARDFIAIARKDLPEHRQIILRRKDLTADVIAAIKEPEGSPQIDQRKIHDNEALKQIFAEQALARRKAFEAGNLSEETPDQAFSSDFNLLEKDNAIDLSEALLSLSSTGGKLGKGKQNKAVSVKSGLDTETISRLIACLRSHDREGFAVEIYRLCELGRHQTMAAIQTGDAGFLAVLMKALAVPQSLAARFLLLLVPDLGRRTLVFKQVLDRYKTLDNAVCIEFLERRGADFAKRASYQSRRQLPEETAARPRDNNRGPVPILDVNERIASGF